LAAPTLRSFKAKIKRTRFMAEPADKLAQMERFLSILEELQHDRKKMIERMAPLQGEAEQAGFGALVAKLGEASAKAVQNFEKLDAVLGDFEMQRN